MNLLRVRRGEYPVLLLDDVLSELDIKRQRFLLESHEKHTDNFITCISINDIFEFRKNDRFVFEVKKGTITRVE